MAKPTVAESLWPYLCQRTLNEGVTPTISELAKRYRCSQSSIWRAIEAYKVKKGLIVLTEGKKIITLSLITSRGALRSTHHEAKQGRVPSTSPEAYGGGPIAAIQRRKPVLHNELVNKVFLGRLTLKQAEKLANAHVYHEQTQRRAMAAE